MLLVDRLEIAEVHRLFITLGGFGIVAGLVVCVTQHLVEIRIHLGYTLVFQEIILEVVNDFFRVHLHVVTAEDDVFHPHLQCQRATFLDGLVKGFVI